MSLLLLFRTGVPAPGGGILHSYTVGNQGTADIVVGQITLELDTGDVDAFTLVSDFVSGATLAPGAQRTFQVRFLPTVAGPYLATVRIPSSDDDGALTIALLGAAVDEANLAPGMAVDPVGTIDFGNVDITTGTSVMVFTVTSTGTAPLVCGTVGLTGSSYAKSADGISGVTIPAGESRTVTVTLDPSSVGTKTGTLTFPGIGVTSVVVNLTGVGTTGAPAPTPTTVTRFYLGRQASPVAQIGATVGWGSETTDPDFLLSVAKGGPVVSLGQAVNNAGYGGGNRLGRWVSPPLAAQTIDSSLLCYAIGHRSSGLGATVTSALRFGVLRAGVVTWQTVQATGAVASAWPDTTAPAPRRFPAGTPNVWRVPLLTLVDGDRLIVELGYRAFSTVTNAARIRYGGASTATDLAATESPATVDLTMAPWIDFTPGLLVLP